MNLISVHISVKLFYIYIKQYIVVPFNVFKKHMSYHIR